MKSVHGLTDLRDHKLCSTDGSELWEELGSITSPPHRSSHRGLSAPSSRREVRWLNLSVFLKKETCDISDECIQALALLAPPLPRQREEKKKEADAVQLCLHRPRPCPHLHPLAACLSRSLGTSQHADT